MQIWAAYIQGKQSEKFPKCKNRSIQRKIDAEVKRGIHTKCQFFHYILLLICPNNIRVTSSRTRARERVQKSSKEIYVLARYLHFSEESVLFKRRNNLFPKMLALRRTPTSLSLARMHRVDLARDTGTALDNSIRKILSRSQNKIRHDVSVVTPRGDGISQ